MSDDINKPLRYRWLIFWILSFGYILVYFHRLCPAVVAVDMMQDYRTGYLVDANPTHQTTVQFFGAFFGALASIPVLYLLLGQLGIGPDSALPAPGAQVWAAMAQAMAGGFEPSGRSSRAASLA